MPWPRSSRPVAGTASALPPAVGAPPTFAGGTSLPNPPASAFAVAAGDFDGDRHRDVVATTSGGVVEWLADGAHPISLGGTPPRSVSADFDRDGYDDLAVGDVGKVAILRGGPTGLTPTGNTTVGGDPFDLAAGDADADGDTDLVVTDIASTSAPVTLLTNDGHGAFAKTPLDSGCASGAISAAIAPLVGDAPAGHRDPLPHRAAPLPARPTRAACSCLPERSRRAAASTAVTSTSPTSTATARPTSSPSARAGASRSTSRRHALVGRTGPTGDAWFNLARGGGSIPLRVVADDVNGDGHADVVTNSHSGAEHTAGVATGDGTGGLRRGPGR